MDAPDVLALPDERCGGPHLRSQRHLAMQSPGPTARQLPARRDLRQDPVERSDAPAWLAASGPRQEVARAIPLAALPAAPRVGCVCQWSITESRRLPVDMVSRRESGPGCARRKTVLPPDLCAARRQGH